MREMLVDLPTDTDELREVIGSMDIPRAIWPAMYALLAAPSLLEVSVPDEHLRALITDVMTNTWFTVKDAPALVRTRKGTRPGDNLGDVLFNLTLVPVLADIGQFAFQHGFHSHAGLLQPGTQQNSAQLADITYADDITMMLHSLVEHPQHMLTHVVRRLVKLLGARALTLNQGATKTAAIITVPRKAAPALLMSQQDTHIDIDVAQDKPFKLHIVQTHTALGFAYTRSGYMGPEVSKRIAAFYTTALSLVSGLPQAIAPRDLTAIVDAVAVPRLLHGAGTWPLLNPQLVGKLDAALLKPTRLMLRYHPTLAAYTTPTNTFGLQ